MVIGLSHYLIVAAMLFIIGVFGIFVNRKNVIVILMSKLSYSTTERMMVTYRALCDSFFFFTHFQSIMIGLKFMFIEIFTDFC